MLSTTSIWKKRYHSKNITQLYDKCSNLLTHPKDIL